MRVLDRPSPTCLPLLLFIVLVAPGCHRGGGGGSNRPSSSDANLADLLVSAEALIPAFNANTTSYIVRTAALTTSTTVTATTSDANATLEINGQEATSGVAFGPIGLLTGTNRIDVVVAAEDRTMMKTYSIIITRPTFTTEHAASTTAKIQVSGLWLVYLADESLTGPSGTDLNGDLDTNDQVAVAVNMGSNQETELGVATKSATILGDEVYLVADESADGKDWNGGGISDVVLLHWSGSAGVVTFVDELRDSTGSPNLLVAGTRLYYSTGSRPLFADETSIRYLEQCTPTTPVAVLNGVGGGALDAELLAVEQGLLFLSLDETSIAQDLNGDLDQLDQHVLALLDGTDPRARVTNVGLALKDETSPVDSVSGGANDWLVAFLVDEAGQGGVNLNDPGIFSQPLLPATCAGNPDTDASDQVLHFLKFADFVAGTSPPVNTGLAGRDRVLAFSGFVATISHEADADCDLNNDGDRSDKIARWVAAVSPVAPVRDVAQMHALRTSTPGGSMGLAHLGDRLIAVVSESDDGQDLDMKPQDHDLVGWLEPTLGTAATWHFAHQNTNMPSIGTGVFDTEGDSEPYAGTDWMAAEPVGDRLGISFLEEVPGTNPNVGSLNTNLDCDFVAKDTDKTDALPVWAGFESGPTLDWERVGYAVDKGNAGIVIAEGFAFFRVSEVDDNRDYNGDGDTGDVVLFRNPLTSCGPEFIATSSELTSPVITTDGDRGAAFLSSESLAGTDFNGDGDTDDHAVRYFLFEPLPDGGSP